MVFKEANDAVAFKQSIFSKNLDYKSVVHVTVNLYVPIFWSLDVRGNRKKLINTVTTTTATLVADALRVNNS